MRNLLTILIAISLYLFSFSAFSQEDNNLSRPGYNSPMTEKDKQIIKESQQKTPEERERSRNIFKEAVKASVRDITFYGKVVDFNGNPVPKAVAVISVRKFDPTMDVFFSSTKHELKTDTNGLFEFRGKGISLSIRDIMKEGYEFKREYLDCTSFQYDIKIKNKHGQALPFDPNSNETYMFKIRQHGVVDYLLTDSFDWRFRKSKNKAYRPQLIGEWEDKYGEKKSLKQSEESKSLEISCVFNEDCPEFELSFEAVVENTDIYLSDELLYQAPAEGYQRKITYHNTMVQTTNDGRMSGWYDKKLYLYVKGPEEMYYSRIDLRISTTPITQYDDDALVQISSNIYTNPQGRRYLDYSKDSNNNEMLFRKNLFRKRSKAEYQALKNKKPFDEKAFRKEVDEKYKTRDWHQIVEEEKSKKDKIQTEG